MRASRLPRGRGELMAPVAPTLLSDLDGTLSDSHASVVAAFRWWAGHRGLDPDAVAAAIPFGRSSTDAAAVLAPQLPAAREGALLDDRQAERAEGVVALPGARDLLGDGLVAAIVTSCPRRLALARLRAADLPQPAMLLTPEDWAQGKPDPEPAAVDCIVLEDAPAGVESARTAGMRVIGVLSRLRADELPGAEAYVSDLQDVPATLQRLGGRRR